MNLTMIVLILILFSIRSIEGKRILAGKTMSNVCFSNDETVIMTFSPANMLN